MRRGGSSKRDSPNAHRHHDTGSRQPRRGHRRPRSARATPTQAQHHSRISGTLTRDAPATRRVPQSTSRPHRSRPRSARPELQRSRGSSMRQYHGNSSASKRGNPAGARRVRPRPTSAIGLRRDSPWLARDRIRLFETFPVRHMRAGEGEGGGGKGGARARSG